MHTIEEFLFRCCLNPLLAAPKTTAQFGGCPLTEAPAGALASRGRVLSRSERSVAPANPIQPIELLKLLEINRKDFLPPKANSTQLPEKGSVGSKQISNHPNDCSPHGPRTWRFWRSNESQIQFQKLRGNFYQKRS